MHPPLPSIIYQALLADKRPPTGKLHCSSHSHWPLRFTQLSQVIETEETDFGSLVTMGIGTMTHKWLEDYFVKHPEVLGDDWILARSELNLDIALPRGWTGTLDWLFQHVPTKTYVIGDLKTAKPESLAWLDGKPKEGHHIQVSCYRQAIVELLKGSKENSPIDPDIFVVYLPKGKTAKQETVLPELVTAPAYPDIFLHLETIRDGVKLYTDEVGRTGELINRFLAPMPLPEPKVSWNKAQNSWDVIMRPSWTETFIGAQFGEELCPRTPSQKVGHYTIDLNYVPRRGVAQPNNLPRPDQSDIKRRRY